jgi:hypothetical protein
MTFLSLKNDVKVPSKSNKEKKFRKKLFFVDVLKVTDEKNSRIGSGSISQRYGSADQDPSQNFMDPQHFWMSAYLSTRTNTGLWKL